VAASPVKEDKGVNSKRRLQKRSSNGLSVSAIRCAKALSNLKRKTCLSCLAEIPETYRGCGRIAFSRSESGLAHVGSLPEEIQTKPEPIVELILTLLTDLKLYWFSFFKNAAWRYELKAFIDSIEIGGRVYPEYLERSIFGLARRP